ncbi:hypothetical protein [Synechococcus sp. BA-132 BA5]|uniref:hypothetical protein n=1 Tax=Synechococcus sp. BA-132 BA5 TaxID=3110252 RepID=UPI002B21343B|nr:hypothetical protein [Synechococcus sp. BA-132 BA5]MEA5413892.1 hypothetical protein [Synechococcus sp. BA-132 BA5]
MTGRHFIGRVLSGFASVMSVSLLSNKSSACAVGTVVAGMVAASSLALAPAAQASTTTFNLTSPSAVNSPSPLSFGPIGVDNIILTLSNPQGSNLPTNSLNTKSSGFCAFAVVGNSGGRCGYLAGSDGVINGFSLSFDKSVYLRQFDIAGFQNLTGGSISFGSQLFNFTGNGTQTFANPFLASAGSTILVTTTGTPAGQSGVFRLSNLQVELAPEVPGPLPLLGAGAAFAYSRKLRTRILKKAS